jgi:3-keto-5-aminohexanoate cleavage enzyme
MDGDAAIVEVGLNEAALRAQNPHVPYSPAECAADAARCAAAGAAVVHWHARDPVTGEQCLADVALHREALEGMRHSGVLAYPSYPIDVETVDERLGHCWALREQSGLELAPVDVGSVSVVIWDDRTHRFPLVDIGPGVVANPLAFTLAALERIDMLAMVPSLGAFDVGFTRTVAHLVDSGKLRPPVLLKIFLAGAWAVGPFPSEEALDFHLRQLPADLDVEWLVVPYALADPALIERLCRYALERGGGIRVGVGDNPTAHPDLPNAALVERAARWAADTGRPLATPAEVRRRFGLDGHQAGTGAGP